MLIPYGSELCGYCRVVKEEGKKCPCLCHVQHLNRSKHHLTGRLTQEGFKLERTWRQWPVIRQVRQFLQRKFKGEKFETI